MSRWKLIVGACLLPWLALSGCDTSQEKLLLDEPVSAWFLPPEKPEDIRAFREMLKSEDLYLQGRVLQALSKRIPEAAPAVPELVTLLKSAAPEIQSGAARVLGMLGEPAAKAAPQLLPLLQSPEARVRYWAAWSLGRLKGQEEQAVPSLIELLSDQEAPIRWRAAEALGRYGLAAAAAKEGIEALLAEDQPLLLQETARHALLLIQ